MNIKLSQKRTSSSFLRQNQREILIGFCVLLVLTVGWFFPIQSAAESLFASLVLLFAFPLIIIKFLLKEPLANFGLGRGNPKIGTISALSFAAVMIVIMSFLVKIPEMNSQISLLPGIAGSFPYFLGAELVIIPMIFFSREFFFRGFVQFGLEEKLGGYALLLQAALFSLIFVRSSWLEFVYAFFSALAAGLIAKFSRSVYYSFLALWIISLVIDIIIIRMASRGI